jgi:translation initiation factor IF-1
MNNGDKSIFTVEGVVVENLPNTMFRVKLAERSPADLAGKVILCHLAGKMRLHYVKLLPGDSVRIEINKLDYSRGRIVFKIRS